MSVLNEGLGAFVSMSEMMRSCQRHLEPLFIHTVFKDFSYGNLDSLSDFPHDRVDQI